MGAREQAAKVLREAIARGPFDGHQHFAFANALADAGLLTEANVDTEWGVRRASGEYVYIGSEPEATEFLAAMSDVPRWRNTTLVTRQRVHGLVTAWTPAGDPDA